MGRPSYTTKLRAQPSPFLTKLGPTKIPGFSENGTSYRLIHDAPKGTFELFEPL